MLRQNVADRRLEAPLDAIALHRASHLLADGKAEPRHLVPATVPLRRFPSRTNAGVAQRAPAANAQELGPPLERRKLSAQDRAPAAVLRRGVGHAPPRGDASSRQTLAALGAAARQDAASSCSLHALAKPVAPLANEPARLVGALHFSSPVSRRRYRDVLDAMGTRPESTSRGRAAMCGSAAEPAELQALIGGGRTSSQSRSQPDVIARHVRSRIEVASVKRQRRTPPLINSVRAAVTYA